MRLLWVGDTSGSCINGDPNCGTAYVVLQTYGGITLPICDSCLDTIQHKSQRYDGTGGTDGTLKSVVEQREE